jgi:hypothetical protein
MLSEMPNSIAASLILVLLIGIPSSYAANRLFSVRIFKAKHSHVKSLLIALTGWADVAILIFAILIYPNAWLPATTAWVIVNLAGLVTLVFRINRRAASERASRT